MDLPQLTVKDRPLFWVLPCRASFRIADDEARSGAHPEKSIA